MQKGERQKRNITMDSLLLDDLLTMIHRSNSAVSFKKCIER